MSVRSLRYNTIEQHFTKGVTASTDRDALAFLEAAQIYNANQQRAIVNLVRSLKRVGLWSKMKAIYPFVGGTASSHKWNLKDPRDVDAAFRLEFNGGWTHSANGAAGNGTNGYAKMFFGPAAQLSNSSAAGFVYNRQNGDGGGLLNDFGVGGAFAMLSRLSNTFYGDCWGPDNTRSRIQTSLTDRRGLVGFTRTSLTSLKGFRNGAQIGSTVTGTTNNFSGTGVLVISAYNQSTTGLYDIINYTSIQIAFASFGDGLTDTDATNLYNIVQRYQFQLGRAIEPDAQAFIDAAGITDATQQAAILDLVVRLKNDGLWSKMKAIYPFVGGTATSHMYNLKDPRNADAAFRLSFQGGWTHSANGADPNGTNGYADTFLKCNEMAQNSMHISYYSRENAAIEAVDIGSSDNKTSPFPSSTMALRWTDNKFYAGINNNNSLAGFSTNSTNTQAYYIGSRNSSTVHNFYRNGTSLGTQNNTSVAPNIYNIYISAQHAVDASNDRAFYYSSRQCAFATIGDGLTDNDVTNLYNIVDLYQRRLGRNV